MKEYPVVVIVGPRQSGKTTLAKKLFPDKPYRSLEHPGVRLRAERDPEAFLADFPNGAVLDEVQRVPALLSYIQGIVDERGENGLFARNNVVTRETFVLYLYRYLEKDCLDD